MSSKAKSLHCVVDVDLSAVTCPGVWLPRRQEVYISVCFLGQYRRTCLVAPTFPLIFRESLRFEKTFYDVRDPSHVCRLLEGQHMLIELIQLSPFHEEGILLAFYETSARNFLFPSSIADGNGLNRYLLFEKTNDFPSNGISPRLEFRTFTEMKDAGDIMPDAMRRSRSARFFGYQKPTFSSAIRAMEAAQTRDARPTFVTRKVSENLIGRMPGASASRAYLHNTKRKSSPLSPYTRYSEVMVEPEVEPYVPRLYSSAIHRSLSAPRFYDWEPYPMECSPPPPPPPHPAPYGYDSIDLLARDLERASLRY